jgi:hypothetical protein
MTPPISGTLYRLSGWGRTHKRTARFLIAGGHVVLAGMAILLGAIWLPYAGTALLLAQLVLFSLGGGIAIVYAKKKTRRGPAGWVIRKKLEGGILACGFFLLLLAGPALREDKVDLSIMPAYAATIHAPVQKAQTKVGRFLKQVTKWYVEGSIFVKILSVIGLLIVAAALGMCLAAISCGIACNGYGVVAAVLLILGSAAITAGIIHFCIRIFESKARAERRNTRRLEQGKEEARF